MFQDGFRARGGEFQKPSDKMATLKLNSQSPIWLARLQGASMPFSKMAAAELFKRDVFERRTVPVT